MTTTSSKPDACTTEARLRSLIPLHLAKSEKYFILDVTGKKQAYFTFWMCVSIPGVCRNYTYLQNVSTDFEKAAAFCEACQQRSGFPVTVWSDTTQKIKTLARDGIIGFGKYSGRHIIEIAETDLGYVKWLARKANKYSVRELAGKVVAHFEKRDVEALVSEHVHALEQAQDESVYEYFENPDRELAVRDYVEYVRWAQNGGDLGPTGHGDECYSDADPGL